MGKPKQTSSKPGVSTGWSSVGDGLNLCLNYLNRQICELWQWKKQVDLSIKDLQKQLKELRERQERDGK